MADKKISQLTAVSTPLAGTEELPAVQSGSTKKVTVAQITNGLLKTTDIGTTVQGYDATTLKSAAIGVTVQGYDADTAKLDVAQTWTADQTLADIAATSFELRAAGVITEAGTTRTLGAGDNGKVIYCTSGSAVTITTASGLGAGFSCTVIQGGAGQITFAQGSSTTLASFGALLKTSGQYAAASIICPVADTFILAGNVGS